MGLWEAIKDVLGVVDDAKDVTDIIRKKMDQVDAIFDKFKRESDDLKQKIKLYNKEMDLREVERLMDKLDIRSPLLIGRTILERLEDIKKDLVDLKRKVSKLPRKIQGSVKGKVEAAIDSISRSVKDHATLLKQIDAVQDRKREAGREVAKTIAVSGVITVAAAAGVAYVLDRMLSGLGGMVTSAAGRVAAQAALSGGRDQLQDAAGELSNVASKAGGNDAAAAAAALGLD